MADIADVMNSFVAAMAQVIYPNGTGQPSITGLATIIYAGWPQNSQLGADLAALKSGAGRVHVTVYPSGAEKNTTKYSNDWQPLTSPVTTLTLTQVGQVVTVSGTVSTPQNIALMVDGLPYTYAVQGGDTLTSIATAFAVQIPGATSAGAGITVPATARVQAARVGGTATMFREIRRQTRGMQITVWADTPAHREATAQAIDVALGATEFITMADQSAARIIYQSSRLDDATQRANLYRRDLMYSVEYATTQSSGATQIVVVQENLHSGVSGSSATTSNQTFYQ